MTVFFTKYAHPPLQARLPLQRQAAARAAGVLADFPATPPALSRPGGRGSVPSPRLRGEG